MLQIKGLSLNKQQPILSQIECTFQRGSITGLLGKSGCGKSSLLRCLAGLETAYEGEIIFADKSLKEQNLQARRRLVGFVSQSYPLFPHLNVLENCIKPALLDSRTNKKNAVCKAKTLLHALSMGPWIQSMPQTLSGGQQQRVAIAQLLMLNPLFILLDEPSSALDLENTRQLQHLLKNLAQEGHAIVIATQDIAFSSDFFDQTLFFEQGYLLKT